MEVGQAVSRSGVRWPVMTEAIAARVALAAWSLMNVSTLAISWRLWTPYREFPMVPVLPGLAYPLLLEVALFAAVLAGSAVALVPVRRARLAGLLCALVAIGLLWVEDQERMQPYIYTQVVFGASLLLYFRTGRSAALNAFRVGLCAVYFWSGFHKLNVHYTDGIFPWVFLGSFLRGSALAAFLTSHVWLLRAVALGSAVAELSIAPLLVWRRTRPLGVVAAVFTHALILVLIGPLGLDVAPVVWPWNVAMAAYVATLFGSSEAGARAILVPGSAWHGAVAVLFVVAPVLNLFSLWDAYLSFHAFSGAQMDAYVRVAEPDRSRVTAPMARAMGPDGRINFFDWTMQAGNFSSYPAQRVFLRVFADLCRKLPPGSRTELVVLGKPSWPRGKVAEEHRTCEQVLALP